MPAGFHARLDRSALCVDRYQQPCNLHSLDRAARIVHGAASCAGSGHRAAALPRQGGGGDTDGHGMDCGRARGACWCACVQYTGEFARVTLLGSAGVYCNFCADGRWIDGVCVVGD